MEFFSELEKLFALDDLHTKLEASQQFITNFHNGVFDYNHHLPIKTFRPTYEAFCEIVPPQKVPRRGFGDIKKRAYLIHAIAHIEYSAIDLAFDACYRFREMPMEFYQDWIEVADDEIRHFNMICELLNEIGYQYGDIPVHNSLYQASINTPNLIERMAIVPRWLEANGLDANEQIIHKLQKYDDNLAKKLIDNLYVILQEEISHVQKGDKWFKWAAQKEGYDPQSKYFEIVNKFYKNIKKPHINIKARMQAGFSCGELQQLSKNKIEC
ncbi:MAG: ferritin-like domain-containing protein [Epsilonproteobacteria bacterium]|nr:ferritin-like domain-containing protein [Campylobacterota bacterium]